MWYLLLVLWAYGAVFTVFVTAELDERADRCGHCTLPEMLQLALVALFIWPAAVPGVYKEWNG